MMLRENQAQILRDLAEGDVIEAGVLFDFAPEERLAWTCVGIETLESGEVQYTFHVYFMGIMLRAVRGNLNPQTEQVKWGGP